MNASGKTYPKGGERCGCSGAHIAKLPISFECNIDNICFVSDIIIKVESIFLWVIVMNC